VPAPRACRHCGADLAPDVRWCTYCFAPIAEFQRRPPTPGGFVDTPRHDVRYTRWRGGPLTFGPIGRLGITFALALGFAVAFWPMGTAFWGLGLWFLLGYSMFSAIVLRAVWGRMPVDADEESGPPRHDGFRRHHPRLGQEIHVPRIAAGAIGLVLLATLGYAIYGSSDDLHRFFALAAILTMAFGIALARWLDL
jgi:hypothetical protein